ncbi:universal stress protein [Streptomyces albidoflavus]|uniref:universal stress protein n=1 Tax=Streptomyces TaxID=1883 RepID=UPI00063E9329|nr:universal stress protein [Streptomyces sp. KE1]KLI96913.1 universal stress protein UspA [Streptomyces sp. KE1]
MTRPVLVGIDGSDESLDAVAAAAREAADRGCPLRIVHAFIWPMLHVQLTASALGPTEGGLLNQARSFLDEAVARAEATVPGLETDPELITGEALSVLAAESRDAVLTVVASRGLGGFSSLLLGSTAIHLAAHGESPVLVLRGRPDPQGPVVLGLDGSPQADGAVGFAFATAARRAAPLVALHAWSNWTQPAHRNPGEPMPLVTDLDRLQDDEQRLLAEALAGWQARYPQVQVERRLLRSRTRPALIEASRTAQLVVVGARGRGGFAGLLLGSTSQALLHHADCPVAVIRDVPADS